MELQPILLMAQKRTWTSCHFQFSSVQLLSCVWLFVTPWTTDFLVHHQFLELTQIYANQVGDAIQPSYPLSSPFSPAFSLSQNQGLFQWVGSSHQMAKVLEFQLQHQSFNEYSGLISFRMDWLDVLAVQGTLKSLLQNHTSKTSILWCSAFFMVQLSYPYMTSQTLLAK